MHRLVPVCLAVTHDASNFTFVPSVRLLTLVVGVVGVGGGSGICRTVLLNCLAPDAYTVTLARCYCPPIALAFPCCSCLC
ncbi:hypothetical protein K435DRAFT_284876 [Dendrothele bispora CBS 962.96]|uniref:Uncharacterized protein n=1 Tax=Dendrothele bispora (strain CBS 962.96) TaxID=1314807 RepID=A0A4S8ML94_DENBC|nr:hypothetical protein K435DRAFT_284876 [Dendrothele bispora CBS 962.96]